MFLRAQILFRGISSALSDSPAQLNALTAVCQKLLPDRGGATECIISRFQSSVFAQKAFTAANSQSRDIFSKSGAMAPAYIGALDQGTTSTRFIMYDEQAHQVASHQLEHQQICPQAG